MRNMPPIRRTHSVIVRILALAGVAALLAGCAMPYAFVQPDVVGSGGYYTSDGVYAAPGYYGSYGPGYYDATPYYPGGYGYYGYGSSFGLSLGYSSGWGGYPYGYRSWYPRHAGCYYRHCGGYPHGHGNGHGNWHGGHGSWSHHGGAGQGHWSHGHGSWTGTGGHVGSGHGGRGPSPPRIVQPPSGSRHFHSPVSTGQFNPPPTRIIRAQPAPTVRPARPSPGHPRVHTN